MFQDIGKIRSLSSYNIIVKQIQWSDMVIARKSIEFLSMTLRMKVNKYQSLQLVRTAKKETEN